MQHTSHNETIFTVDDASDLPIWVQIRNRIAHLIRVGYFKPGEQIPSVRSLSTSAKINYNTVTKAYKDLEQNNLIVSIRGRGMYVNKNIKNGLESPESVVDMIVEDCIKQYRAIGMTYEDILARMKDTVVMIVDKAATDVQENTEY